MFKWYRKTGVVILTIVMLFVMLQVTSTEVSAAVGWQTIDGNTYYYDNMGNKVIGWKNINGFKYYFNKLGLKSSRVGIDVSSHQGTIDWNAVKESGVDYAIIRIGYGNDLVNQDDSQAIYNMNECERLGIPYGVYLYSYALSFDEVNSEVQHALRMINGRNPILGVYYDMEDADSYKSNNGMPSNDTLSQFCVSFITQISDAGYKAGLYSNKYWLTNILTSSQLNNFDKWVAQYNDECTYEGNFTMWQYTSSGLVNGINGNVDLDVWLVSTTGVVLNKTSTTLTAIGAVEQLTATIEPINAANQTVKWSSSSEAVASVDTSGKVTAVGNGTAIITATTEDGSFTASCEVTVAASVTGVVINKESITLTGIGAVRQLRATIEPVNAVNQTVTWSSSDESIAVVDTTGKVTTTGYGMATITATTEDGNYTASCEVTVAVPVTGVALNKGSITLTGIGAIEQLTATIAPINAANKTVNWSSNNEAVASVDTSGKVTAVGNGTAIITATTEDGSFTSSCEVTVTVPVTGVALNKGSITLTGIGAVEQLAATIAPINAANKTVTWSSNNEAVASVDTSGKVTATGIGTANITATTEDGNYTASCEVTVQIPPVSVNYTTHVQDYGWQDYVSDGAASGTSGQSKRLEGIKINVENDSDLGIEYTTHVQDYGWQNYVSDDVMSGTSGQSKRLEAIKIKLTGADADLYDVYYRVHAQDYGWLGWAKNGEAAGTEGLSKRLEAIEIIIIKKSDDASGFDSDSPFVSTYGIGSVNYRTHVQDYGWQNYVSDGTMSGTSGQSKRLEGINIRLSTNMPSGSIIYSTHVQDYGWMASVSDGTMSGTSGQSKRLEAIRINLTGEVAQQYDIYYRVHAQNVGWMGWAKNGQDAGTAGFAYRLEGIEIVLVEKGGVAPGSTENAFIQK